MLQTKEDHKKQIKQNVMEMLVAEEIERQLKKYPPKQAAYINQVEVATYALNRLPPLYACSQKGFNLQLKKGRQELREEIKIAVRRGFAAIHQDPLLTYIPLVPAEELDIKDVKQQLLKMVDLLYEKDFYWLLQYIKHLLNRIKQRKITEEEIKQFLG